jgi:hypothetical protein
MNVEIWTETPIFLFWEYLYRNFGILSLQCVLVFFTSKVTRIKGSIQEETSELFAVVLLGPLSPSLVS